MSISAVMLHGANNPTLVRDTLFAIVMIILGGMIGGALVGTFMGVFLAYGLVGPFSTRLNAVVEEEGSFYKIIQSVLVAHLHGNAAQVSVEIGRGSVPSEYQPSFAELENALNTIPPEGA